MRALVQEISDPPSPEALAARLANIPGTMLLRSCPGFDSARYSFLAAWPFLTFRSRGAVCETISSSGTSRLFGNPWQILSSLLNRYELLDQLDFPFPLGACIGYWGYDLGRALEPRLSRHAAHELDCPDCHLGFYESLVAYDHHLGRAWILSSGMEPDGSRSLTRARARLDRWRHHLNQARPELHPAIRRLHARSPSLESNLTRPAFLQLVERALAYIRAGDIYQVNLSQRFNAPALGSGWDLFRQLAEVSPAPFSAYLQCGSFQVISSSPELFLKISGDHVRTRPIKGTRPRSDDPTRDAQLSYELQTNPKEMAELVMITDLLRNDLGRVCEFGSIHVPELMRLERYPQVQHLVSTVEGRLRPGMNHMDALAACFPGGSITGAPKIRAMEIIDELEPAARGPYTGCLGYLGFNRESQLSIVIRSAMQRAGRLWFQTGAGIVADSDPEAEYEETVAKARGLMMAAGYHGFETGSSGLSLGRHPVPHPKPSCSVRTP